MMIDALRLIKRKSLKIEKDLRVLNLINLKKVNKVFVDKISTNQQKYSASINEPKIHIQ